MKLNEKKIQYLDYFVIISFCVLPLFLNFPYRINIFLSWEGAYRLYQGQIPFKDFGLPMGFMYWVIPALFFKIFGPYLITLVKAQVFINLVSAITFREILNLFKVKSVKRFLTILLFCVTLILINFWPWYNNSVFVFQLISILFVLRGILSSKKYRLIFVILGGLFSFIAFFTKQDGGGFAVLINIVLLTYDALFTKSIINMAVFLITMVLISGLFIIPILPYDFNYWFNYGQEPHYSRVNIKDILAINLGGSNWIKFYFLLIILSLAIKIKKLKFKNYFYSRHEFLFLLLAICILLQASIIQVTSYVPPDNNIYFHSFAFAFLVSQISLPFQLLKIKFIIISTLLILFWWSGMYYKYVERIIQRVFPTEETEKELISVNTYRQHSHEQNSNNDNSDQAMTNWKFVSDMEAFKNVYMPKSTVEGIKRLKQMRIFSQIDVKVLNMTELTPLVYELNFSLEKGTNIPLWYHQNVSLFDRELGMYKQKINDGYYDVVLFEYISNLNNFYPFEIRELLIESKVYRKIDTFSAPRRHGGDPVIEVYLKKIN